MNRPSKDQVLAVLGSGLVGYYLSMSLFRGLVWNSVLLKVLPPINDRHLPQQYTGLFGAVIGLSLGYLLFSWLIDKKTFAQHKKEYLIGVALLAVLPCLVIGGFRHHSVKWVQKAEGSVPTEITVRADTEGSQLMFQINLNQASGVGKSLNVEPDLLQDFGQKISTMELKEVRPSNESQMEPMATLFIDYRVDGKWYSKILNYDNEIFRESITNNQWAIYESRELAEAIEKLFERASNIEFYDQARIITWEITSANKPEVLLTPEQFAELTAVVREENTISPSPQLQNRFQDLLENWVKAEDTDIYAFHLMKEDANKKKTDNFIVYDDANKTLMFEGVFYQADLRELLSKVLNAK